MKRLTIILFFAFLSTSIFAQTDKMKEQAAELVETMNTEITSENPSLALSKKQKTEIGEVIAQRIQAVADLKKTEKDEEKRKEIQKEIVKPFNKKIYVELLSKEQKAALDSARNKAKDKK